MADAPRSTGHADRNLLFGILALQMDFISRDQLVVGMNAWVLAKEKPLGQVLVEQGALADSRRHLLEPLVEELVAQHGGAPEKSLAALGQTSSLRESLAGLKDSEVQASLGHVQGNDVSQSVGTVDWRSAGPRYTGPRFRILRPHARGGLGEVFVAEDQELHREVALKEILDQHADHSFSRTRFLMEAEITGGLEHPGIVPVYGLGSYADGRPFYAMRFIRGDSLKDAIARFHANAESRRDPLALRQLLRRFTDVCNAIAYAHSRGVLHRDLKPGNIMLGKYGETLVVDWGLAKAAASEPKTSITSVNAPPEEAQSETPLRPASGSNIDPTQMGSAIGTPGYMSPEQAAGRLDELGPASDVYSLGATLYALLAGKPAFEGEDKGEVLRRVMRGEFSKPRQINNQAPIALESICLKAMALTPGNRYPTPRALSDEIEHWLADEPVSAYREPWAARTRRWLRRHKSVAAAALAVGLMAVMGLGLVAILTSAAAERERALRGLAEESKQHAEDQEREARHNLYVAHMNLAQQGWENGNVGYVRQLLDLYAHPATGSSDPRGWEWYYQERLCHGDLRTFEAQDVGFASVAFSRDGALIACGGELGVIILRDVATGTVVRTLKGHANRVNTVAFSPDGARLASGSRDNTVKMWDVATGTEFRSGKWNSQEVTGLAFSPDGSKLAIAGAEPGVVVWNAATGREIRKLERFGVLFYCVAFGPDGARLVTGGTDGNISLWNATTGEQVQTFKAPDNQINAVAFSPDGALIACGSDRGGIMLFDATTGKVARTLKGHAHFVSSLTFNPGGGLLASASWDRTIKLWEPATGKEIHTFVGHEIFVSGVAFSPDGARLASAGWNVKLWAVPSRNKIDTFEGHKGCVNSVAFSPDGARIASCGKDATVKLWNATTGKEIRTLNGHSGEVLGVAFSPNGGQIASASKDKTVKLWDAATGKELQTLRRHSDTVSSVTFSPDGAMLASASWDLTVELCDARTGNEIHTLKGHTAQVNSVAFSADGATLASGSDDGTIILWRVARGEEIRRLKGFFVLGVAFSPDGTRLASADQDCSVKLFDTISGSELRALRGHTKSVHGVTFSPDGERLVSSSSDFTMKVWDVKTGNATRTLSGHADGVRCIAFSPDGKCLASGGEDKTIRLWDATPLTAALREDRETRCLVECFLDRDLSKNDLAERLQTLQGISSSARQKAQAVAEIYRTQRVNEQATHTVEQHFAKLLIRPAVLEAIKVQNGISDELRQQTLILANDYPENAEAINQAAWELVKTPGGTAEKYDRGVVLAETALRLEPQNGLIMNTLGVGRYRQGRFAEALQQLERSTQVNSAKYGPMPGDLAFLAMTYHRLGRNADAQSMLERLRAEMKKSQWKNEPEANALMREAEELLGATPEPRQKSPS